MGSWLFPSPHSIRLPHFQGRVLIYFSDDNWLVSALPMPNNEKKVLGFVCSCLQGKKVKDSIPPVCK